MLKSKILKFAFLSLAAMLLLTGCGKTGDGKNETSGEQIVILSGLWSKPTEGEFVVSQILNPLAEKLGISISFQTMDDLTALQRLEVQTASGNICSNIEIASSGSMTDWINSGYLVDLTEKVAGWKDLKFIPAFSKGIEIDGKQYFLPIAGNVYLLIANKKALKYLPKGAKIDELTWDQFADWALNIKKGTGFGRTVVCGVPLKSFIYQFGTCALSYGAEFPEINSEGAKKAWTIFEKLSQADAFIPNIREIADCSLPMIRGEAWLSILNNTKVGEVFETNETKFVVAKMPKGPKGRGIIVGFSGMALIKNSQNQKTALGIIKYLTKPDIQVQLARGTGGFVPAVEAALKFLDVNDPQDIVIRKAIHELKGNVVASGVPGSKYKDWGAVKMVFDNIFERVLLRKEKLTDKMLDEAAEKIKELRK